MNARFKRVTDLFTRGKEVPLPDGSYLWVQVINSYEREECMADASVARARLILALKDKGDERIRVEAQLERVGREALTQQLAKLRAGDKMTEIIEELRDDPEWKERFDIIRRTDFSETATPPSDEEIQTLAKINDEIVLELNRREEEERAFQVRSLERLDENSFLDQYLDTWLERRGTEIMGAEYRLTELWFATRYCNAVKNEDDSLNHERCDGHRERVFQNKAEARSIPDELQRMLTDTLDEVGMGGKDPKDSGSQANSSDSSSVPNEQEESTPSTSTETPSVPPGTSASPSPTP